MPGELNESEWRARVERERAARKEAERLLEVMSRELYEANTALERRVAERTEELNREIAVRRDAELRANEAARLKAQFLANMSHEIRTPMNGVIGMMDALLDGELPPSQRARAEIILGCAKDLMTMLNDILDLSHLEAGRVRLDRRPERLSESVASVVALLGPLADRKGIDLICETGRDVEALVMVDGLRLRQVLTHLVGNAIKFTTKGRVTVSLTRAGDQRYRLEVRDTGIGIPPDRLATIFDPFTQADGSTTRHHGGSGLGLAIVDRLVRLMEGSLQVKSRAGKGSTFAFELVCESYQGLTTSRPEPPKPLKGMRVVVVDDNEVNQLIAEHMVNALGGQPMVLPDAPAVIEYIRNHSVDLVLADVYMPGMDGIQLTNELRTLGFHKPIIAISAGVLEEEVRRCLEAGMNGFVPKPLNREQLAHAVVTCQGG